MLFTPIFHDEDHVDSVCIVRLVTASPIKTDISLASFTPVGLMKCFVHCHPLCLNMKVKN